MQTTGEMARLDMDPLIQHFSHLHPLKLRNLPQQTTNTYICAGCKLEASGWFYFCNTCNYCLHKTCSRMPRNIEHQVDPKHTLALLSSPVYATGSFKCNACGKLGTGFCYHCKDCQLDIHVLCVCKPSSVNTSTHHHALELSFSRPYSKKKFQCDICKQFGSNHWLYRCCSCNYHVHMNCAMANQLQPAKEIQQIKQQILCPAAGASTQVKPVRAIHIHQNPQRCQANGSRSHLQPVTGTQERQMNQLLSDNVIAGTHPQPVTWIQLTPEKKLQHSNSANIQLQPVRAMHAQRANQGQLLYPTADRANTYAQTVTTITQQQPKLLNSQSFPPQFSRFSNLPNSDSTFQHASQPVIPMPQEQVFVPHVQTPNTIPEVGSSNWNQPNEVNSNIPSIKSLTVHQHVPQPTQQMNGYTASMPTFAPTPQNYVQSYTTKVGNHLMGHVVQELVDGFIQQAGGVIFQGVTSGDLSFDLDIANF